MQSSTYNRKLTTADPAAPRVKKGEQRNNGVISRLLVRFRRSSKLARRSISRVKKNIGNYSVATQDDCSLSSSSFDTVERRNGPLHAGQSDAPESLLEPGARDDISDNSIHSCLKLLSSDDLDQNRLGLQRLVLLTRGRTLSGLYRSEEIASRVLVFGGSPGSVEERLRSVFSTMICNADQAGEPCASQTISAMDMDAKEALFDWILDYDPKTGMDGNGKHISYYDIDEFSCSSDCSDGHQRQPLHPQGKAEGALHNHALRILANALEWVASFDRKESLSEMEQEAFQGVVWESIIQSLMENIETNRNVDATGYSLRILRLLHCIHPETIESLLKYALIVHLLFFLEYGKQRLYPMIHSEASYLLEKAGYAADLS
mmetsp:Transcript_18405/g.42257  ORF Transcript_18405/g.42257 Transcript_18405/m.42257 type:complete len:375 (-) Transcript_18405:9-1133(-)